MKGIKRERDVFVSDASLASLRCPVYFVILGYMAHSFITKTQSPFFLN
jgi:hypothetical protein